MPFGKDLTKVDLLLIRSAPDDHDVAARRARISFWDALVVQAALDTGCDRLYSEDLNAGQRFGSLLVVNPFARPVR